MRILPLPVAAILLMTIACSGWRNTGSVAPAVYQPHQQVQIWSAGEGPLLWQRVVVDDSTVSGVPFTEPPECDCRISLPVSEIDSLRIGARMRNSAFGNAIILTTVAVGLGVLTLY